MSRMLIRARLYGKREHNGALTTAAWPAIITEDEHIQLVARLTSTRRPPSRGKHLLTGITWCGNLKEDGTVCGARMVMRPRGKHQAASYVCPPTTGCGRLAIVADKLEAYVVAERFRLDSLMPAPRAERNVYDTTADTNKLSELAVAFANDAITAEQLATSSAVIRARIAAAEAANAQSINEVIQSRTRERVSAAFGTMDRDAQRAALAQLIDRIVIHRTKRTRVFNPDRVAILFHGDDDPQQWVQPAPDDGKVARPFPKEPHR
jgi:site-specific DNA recombinase